jgi:hypothetical protein
MGILSKIKDKSFGWSEIPGEIGEELPKNWASDGAELAEQIEKQCSQRESYESAPEEKTEAEDGNSWSWERKRILDHQLAGAIAKSAEAAGLIHPSDDFSFGWHVEFDPLIAEAQAKAAEASQKISSESTQANELETGNSAASPSNAVSGDVGANIGGDASGDFGGDFGGFSGNFGGGNGNF